VASQRDLRRDLLTSHSTLYPAGHSLSEIHATNQTCTREHLWGSQGFSICENSGAGDQHVCQDRVYSAGLYVAGTVLSGLALLYGLITLALGFSRAIASTETLPYAYLYSRLAQSSHRSRRHQHHVRQQDEDNWKSPQGETEAEPTEEDIPDNSTHFTPRANLTTWRNFAMALGILLAVMGALCLFVAHLLAYNALVSDQAPSGDVSISNPVTGSNPIQSPWYLTHTGVVYASLAWLTAGLGALIASLGACLGGL